MDFGLTEEQDQLAAAERAWLTKNDPIARVRAALDAGAVTVDPAAVAHAVESGHGVAFRSTPSTLVVRFLSAA